MEGVGRGEVGWQERGPGVGGQVGGVVGARGWGGRQQESTDAVGGLLLVLLPVSFSGIFRIYVVVNVAAEAFFTVVVA